MKKPAKDAIPNERGTGWKGLFMIRPGFLLWKRKLMAPVLVFMLAGCAVGPDFKRPADSSLLYQAMGGCRSRLDCLLTLAQCLSGYHCQMFSQFA